MLRVLLDENNDLPPGGPRLVSGLESAGVALQAVFGTQTGEWPYNLTFGMDWRGEVFGKFFDAATTAQLAAEVANTVPDISPPVTAVQVTIDTTTQAEWRQADITIADVSVGTETGDVTISTTF